MGRCINSGTLSKEYILSKVSQVTMFSKYLNIPKSTINDCIKTGNLIKSPIREDTHPTVGFKYDSRNMLKMRDFAGYFWGDCIDIAALILKNKENKNIDVNNKYDFIEVLKFITTTFSGIFYGRENDEKASEEISETLKTIRKSKTKIEIVTRNWNEYDYRYWNKRGVSLKYLNVNFIYPVDQYYINRIVNENPKYYYKENDPCYAYMLGYNGKANMQNVKLYFPERNKSSKFITNCNHLEGILNLDAYNYDIICVTKSTKDRLVLGSLLFNHDFSYGGKQLEIGVINIPHETYNLNETEYEWMKSRLKEKGILCSLMDNDRTGKAEAYKLRKQFGIIPIIINKELRAKDFDELFTRKGEIECVNLVSKCIENVMRQYSFPVEEATT